MECPRPLSFCTKIIVTAYGVSIWSGGIHRIGAEGEKTLDHLPVIALVYKNILMSTFGCQDVDIKHDSLSWPQC